MVSKRAERHGTGLHLHTCSGGHVPNADHFCPKCRTRWFKRGE